MSDWLNLVKTLCCLFYNVDITGGEKFYINEKCLSKLFQETDSPQSPGLGYSRDTEELISIGGKDINPALLESVLSQNPNSITLEDLIRRLQPHNESGNDFAVPCERSSQNTENAGLAQLLSVIAETAGQQDDKKKNYEDIDDEEKFLYGDEEEEDKSPVQDFQNSGQSSLLTVFENTRADNILPESKPDLTQCNAHDEYGTSESHLKMPGEKQYSSTLIKEPCPYRPQTEFPNAKVNNEVKEYEKIRDLLKTIGLDLGVSEIGKMAARTQERLHGNNPAKNPQKKQPLERRHRSRSRSCSSGGTSSGSESRNSSRSRSGSRDSFKHSSEHKSQSQREGLSGTKDEENAWTNTASPALKVMAPSTSSFTVHPAHQMTSYPQTHSQGVFPLNYPPPGYDAYGNYVTYMPQGWPMFPPPGMPPPQSSTERPYLKVIDTGANEEELDKSENFF